MTPDHIVYAKSYYLKTEPMAESVQKFEHKHGYQPHIVARLTMPFGVSGRPRKRPPWRRNWPSTPPTSANWRKAFGGIDYMTDRAREFIENWEVESYRSRQAE